VNSVELFESDLFDWIEVFMQVSVVSLSNGVTRTTWTIVIFRMLWKYASSWPNCASGWTYIWRRAPLRRRQYDAAYWPDFSYLLPNINVKATIWRYIFMESIQILPEFFSGESRIFQKAMHHISTTVGLSTIVLDIVRKSWKKIIEIFLKNHTTSLNHSSSVQRRREWQSKANFDGIG